MSDWRSFNRETAEDRAARRALAQRLTSGARSPIDGLTDAERRVLQSLRRAGYDLISAPPWSRTVVKGAA